MKQHPILIRILVIAACLLVLGGIIYALDIIPRIQPIDWQMQAYELAEDGTVLGTHTLTVKGNLLHYRRKANCFDGEISVSDGYRYGLSKPDEAYPNTFAFFDKLGIFYTSIFGQDWSSDSVTFLSFALDTENESAILRPGKTADDPEAERPYLVASLDSNCLPQEIMEHFPWFSNFTQ